MSYSKYGNYRVTYDGRKFDSKAERKRYMMLKALEKQGYISNLECQKKFVLIPTQREPDIIGPRGGRKAGKLIHKEVAYYADFVYYDNRCEKLVVEDVKGYRTPVYVIKAAMMYYFHKILIKEV